LTVGESSPAPSFFSIVDGSTPSVTSLANYSSSDTGVITVSSPLEAVGEGNSTVTAEYLGFSNSETVEVQKEETDEEVSDTESDCTNRRDLSRGEEGQECSRDRTLGRGGSREELDRETDRRSDTKRRDRSRGERRNSGR
jgi:hypothetical protein